MNVFHYDVYTKNSKEYLGFIYANNIPEVLKILTDYFDNNLESIGMIYKYSDQPFIILNPGQDQMITEKIYAGD